jgi:hypothetical protein
MMLLGPKQASVDRVCVIMAGCRVFMAPVACWEEVVDDVICLGVADGLRPLSFVFLSGRVKSWGTGKPGERTNAASAREHHDDPHAIGLVGVVLPEWHEAAWGGGGRNCSCARLCSVRSFEDREP